MVAAAVRGEWKDTADRDGTPPGSHAAWHTASAENQVHLEPMACSSSPGRREGRVSRARGVAAGRWRVETCTVGCWRPGETQPSCPLHPPVLDLGECLGLRGFDKGLTIVEYLTLQVDFPER